MSTNNIFPRIRIYLFYWAAFIPIAAFVPYLSLYFKHFVVTRDGFPILSIIGILFFINQFLTLFSNPVAGYIADRFKIENRIILVCSSFVITGAILFCIPSLAMFKNISESGRNIFLISGMILIGLFNGPIMPLINTEVLDYIHKNPKLGMNYCSFRVHGSLSWIVMTVIIGLVLLLTKNLLFIVLFYCGGFLLLSILAASGLKAELKPAKIPWKYLKEDKNFLMFLIFCFMSAFTLNTANSFIGYFFDEIKVNYLFIGIAFSVGAFFEIPLMYNAGKINKILSNKNMIIIGTSLLSLRLLLLGISTKHTSIGFILLAMSLNGLGFGIQINGMMNLMDKWAHKDLRATYMNLYTMFGINIPTAFGSILSVYMIKRFSSSFMLLIDVLIIICGILFFSFFVKEKNSLHASD